MCSVSLLVPCALGSGNFYAWMSSKALTIDLVGENCTRLLGLFLVFLGFDLRHCLLQRRGEGEGEEEDVKDDDNNVNVI